MAFEDTTLLSGLGSDLERDFDMGLDDGLGLGAAAKRNRSIVAQSIERMKEPGTVNPTVWAEFRKLVLGLPVDLTKVTVEDKEYFDTLGVAVSTTIPAWTVFANRDAALPGICNLPRGQVLSDRPFLCEAIAVYVPNSLTLAGTTLGVADEAQQAAVGRRAGIQQFLETAEYEFREGNQTMLQGRVAHLTEPPFGPQAAQVIAAGTGGPITVGGFRNGFGKLRRLPQPIIFVNGRPNSLIITNPAGAANGAAGAPLAIRAALFGREVRPGGYFAS
jgi:hypothetical protein